MPDTVPASGDSKELDIMPDSEDLATKTTETMECEHCKESSMCEICWEYTGKKMNSKLEPESISEMQAEPMFFVCLFWGF